MCVCVRACVCTGMSSCTEASFPFSLSPSSRHQAAPSTNVAGMMPIVLPKLGYIQLIVSEVVDPAHFWAQRVDTSATVQLQSMMDAINASSDRLIPLLSSTQDLVGQQCLAPYSENGQYYRAKVQSIAPSTGLVMVRLDTGKREGGTTVLCGPCGGWIAGSQWLRLAP